MSDFAAYAATRKVRHIAVWTADDAKPGDAGHRWRSLCGRRTAEAQIFTADVAALPDWLAPEWREQLTKAAQRPVCKDCTSTAREAYTLTAGGAL